MRLALLIPREHKVEHSNLLKELSDEQSTLRPRLQRRLARRQK